MVSVLLLSLSLAGSPPAKSHSAELLRTHCLLWAADPTNPWALAHGVKTLGPQFLASDGRLATNVIFEDFLKKSEPADGGVALYGFPPYGPDGKTPIEPHPGLNLKALLTDAHVSSSSKVKTPYGVKTLLELVESTKLGFRYAPSVTGYWKNNAWTLGLFSMTEKPGTKWKTSEGQDISVDKVFDEALTALEADTAELKAAMEKHQPQVDKRKQGIYAHACGGLHFVQGTLGFARNPEVRKRWGKRIDTQIAIHFYRLESERRQYDAAYQQALNTAPQYKPQILVQMLKFYGHWLETTAHFKEDLGWKPTAAQAIDINRAKAYLDVAVRLLEEAKAFENMKQLREKQYQLYLDLIGDSCHAARGLEAFP